MESFPAALERQAGYFNPEEQEALGRSRVAVLGLGGVGGVAAELLARAGVGSLVLSDGDVFETSNLNRQAGSLHSTLGRPKAEVAARRLLDINPGLSLALPGPVETAEDARSALDGAAAGVLAVDRLGPTLEILRAGRRLGSPLVEAVALPVLQVRTFAPGGPDPEEGLTGPEETRPADLGARLMEGWRDGRGDPLALSPDMALATARGGGARSLGPLVWICGALAALEVMKLLTGKGKVAYYPQAASLDPCTWRLHLAT